MVVVFKAIGPSSRCCSRSIGNAVSGHYCQAQPQPQLQLSWAEIALISAKFITTHHIGSATVPPRKVRNLRNWSNLSFLNWWLLVRNLFMLCLRLVHDLFITCSLLVHDFFTICNDLFMTCLWLIHDLFMTCLQLVHNFAQLDYLKHFAWNYFFITWVMSCSLEAISLNGNG